MPAKIAELLGEWTGTGSAPTLATGVALVDAYLWVKIPGESDGECTRGLGPAARPSKLASSAESSRRPVARPPRVDSGDAKSDSDPHYAPQDTM